ncbi:MAG: hypothetical protein A2534_01230 [Candidatus Magasanikbacteria bacterium RIFOXYD2_FULL_39_9]|uniref:Uncharacterized protein n=1 Tax=Candidatus Magasanikbacteria bacterium RIFOXYD1_FULL_40_23 TaxID=1798705 RepID=A0A1F6P8Z1_9BACT|nr:MAG: hypothetical protein A2534_01230 [Candidatus Magasanikbacteria bacterium RIFOXYD2_FULL_39_9]OGH92651.1 MAG: hypothetical protein A2563_03180 [Candidatus Magasanikbacteria bacterium RIFOXYD1_FULL_40_23]
MDNEKNKEEQEFNAAQQAAVDKARALPKAIYENINGFNSQHSILETDIGVEVTKNNGPFPGNDERPYSELYSGYDDGDVVRMKNSGDAYAEDFEFFPPQLGVEDIVKIIKKTDDYQSSGESAQKLLMEIMVERGVDPKTTPTEKLQLYLYGHKLGRENEDVDIEKLIQNYTKLWEKREEKQKAASEVLQATAENQAATDKEAAAAVLDKIEKIPEAPLVTSAKVEAPQITATVEEPPAPPKKGFFKRLFGGK